MEQKAECDMVVRFFTHIRKALTGTTPTVSHNDHDKVCQRLKQYDAIDVVEAIQMFSQSPMADPRKNRFTLAYLMHEGVIATWVQHAREHRRRLYCEWDAPDSMQPQEVDWE